MSDGVTFQSLQPATPSSGVKVKTTLTGEGHVEHVNVDHITPDVSNPLYVIPASYHASPFGGFRVAPDFLAMDNVHTYPGAASAYDPNRYGFEADAGGKGTITHLPNESALRLAISDNTNAAKARLRTHDQIRYQAGAAPHIKLTAYGSSGDLYSVVRSSVSGSVVDTRVPVASWSDSQAAVDVTKGNIYEIMYQWLGVGEVMYFVNGILRHISQHAGILSVPYMKTAILPISVEIVNDAGIQYIRFGQFDDSDGVFFEVQRPAGAGEITYICSSGRILNGQPYPVLGYGFSAAKANVTNVAVPLMSFQIKSTLIGVPSRVQLLPAYLSFFSETQPGACGIIMNPSLTGASFAATSPSDAIEIDTAASALSGGTLIWRVGLGANGSQSYPLEGIFSVAGPKVRRQAFTGTSDILSIAVVREGAVNFDPRVTLNWQELR